METSLRIAFLTINDPHDRRSWSGTEYSMAKALERHCGTLCYVGPLDMTRRKVHRKLDSILGKLAGRSFRFSNRIGYSRRLGRLAAAKIRQTDCNVIFAPAQSLTLAHLGTDLPIVYSSDATIRIIHNYYGDFTNIFPRHLRAAEGFESLSIQRAKRLVYPSQWAANSAIEHYGANPSKVSVVPLGASMDSFGEPDKVTRVPKTDICRLLFVGREWERKGGEIALEAFRDLKRRGLKVGLSIVGCAPPSQVSEEGLQVFPFLNKNIPEQYQRLMELYSQAHFFILPTRAECFGVALCEANAAGIPVLTTNTGGIPSIVREGVNGFMFPLEARGERYAEVVEHTFASPEAYGRLRVTSRNEFDTRLNWDHWGAELRQVLLAAIADGK